MTNLNSLTPEKILAIPKEYPERLYVGNSEDDIKKMYRKLSSLWHPDKHISDKLDTNSVFKHIKELYDKALEKMQEGTWNLGQVINLYSIEGKKYQVKYQTNFSFDLGQCYISSKFVTYIIEKDNEDLMIRGIKNLSNLNFANNEMKAQFKHYLPEIHTKIETKDNFVLVFKKSSELLVLKDVLNYFGGKMPVRHAAWIISSMYNVACYIQYNHLMHGGFSLDSYFINPEKHEAALLGGWWFSHRQGESLVALNKEASSICPINLLNSKKAGIMLDLESIKLVGRQLLGDSSGVYLSKNKDIPLEISQFLRDGAGNDAIKEYQAWHTTLVKAYGARRFTEMKLTEKDIYQVL